MHPCRAAEGGVILFVRVIPKSSQNCIIGMMEGRLKIKVQAPADKGKANAAVVSLLAKKLKLPASCFAVAAGLSSRTKSIFIQGVSVEEIEELL